MLTKLLKKQTKQLFSEKFSKFNKFDALNLESQLEETEISIMYMARDFCSTLMPPIVNNYRNLQPNTSQLMKQFGEMGFLGCTLNNYGASGVNYTSYGLINREVERIDSSYRSALSVQSSLVIHPINLFGQQQIKDKYLPELIQGNMIGCFGLTEPDVGSDPSGMKTTCKKQKDNSWIINGSKNWITNSPIADVFIVWAKDQNDGKIKGFVLDRNMPGIETPKIDGKMSLQLSETGMIMLEEVHVPQENQLQVEGLKGPFSCLNNARFGISWGVLGAAEFCYQQTLNYLQDRKQFDCVLAGYQIPQKKLAEMLTDISLGLQGCLQLARLKDSDQLAVEMISMMKRNNCMKAIQIARDCRELLGGNGIVDEYHIIRHVMNLEAVNTYEGTNDIHALILGRAITGIQAFSRKIWHNF